MTRFEHPFAKVYRAVLKEKYPNRETATPVDDILEDVVDEALLRYYADKRLFIGPRIWVNNPANTAQKQEIKPTIQYV